MAHHVLTNAKVWVASFDLSGDMNALSCEYLAEAKDDTCFGDTTQVNMGGNKSVAYEQAGHWEGGANAVDDVLFSRVGTADIPISFDPGGGTEGNVAYFFRSVQTQYQLGSEQGEILPFTVSGTGSDHLVRGTVMLNATKTASGNGTARSLGAVSTSQKLYAVLHVPTYGSGTWTITVESDDASAFTTPTTRATFSNVTGITSEWATPVDGAITDTWWRVTWSGTGSVAPVVIVGIK